LEEKVFLKFSIPDWKDDVRRTNIEISKYKREKETFLYIIGTKAIKDCE
jgi:hypothetical protein